MRLGKYHFGSVYRSTSTKPYDFTWCGICMSWMDSTTICSLTFSFDGWHRPLFLDTKPYSYTFKGAEMGDYLITHRDWHAPFMLLSYTTRRPL